MEMNRRHFVALTVLGLAAPCAGGEPAPPPGATPAPDAEPIDAGPMSGFSSDGVDARYREQGFFVIRRNKQVFALSSICTHKGCKVRVANDQSFYCKCHGSEFDRDGRVTQGPAKRNLPRLAVRLDERRHLMVDPSQPIENP